VTSFDFLSLKNDVNVRSKSNKQKNLGKKNLFFVGVFTVLKVNDENSRIGSTPKCHGYATQLQTQHDISTIKRQDLVLRSTKLRMKQKLNQNY
jgi:hypothetical protein